MKKSLCFFVTLFCWSIQVSVGQVVKYADDFLDLGGFSSLKSLGGAGLSYIDGCEAAWGNPSMPNNRYNRMDFAMMHGVVAESMASRSMASAMCRLDSMLSATVSLLRVGVDDIQNTINLYDSNGNIDYSNISYFSVADYAAYISICRLLRRVPYWSVGGSLKLLYRREGPFAQAYGFGLDIAATYRRRRFAASAVLRDATTTFCFWSVNEEEFGNEYIATGNSIPEEGLEQRAPSLALSVAQSFRYNRFDFTCMAAFYCFFGGDTHYLLHSKQISADPSFGFETKFADVVSIRIGISSLQRAQQLTLSHTTSARGSFGAGLALYGFRLDYAIEFGGALGLKSNMFTIGWGR